MAVFGRAVRRPATGSRLSPLRCRRRAQASLRRIRDPASGEIIDEGLVLWFPGPGELHRRGHGGVPSAWQPGGGGRRWSGCWGACPAIRLAEPGEFTRRALANGRTRSRRGGRSERPDEATSAAQRRQALFHMEGDASRVFAGWRGDLVGCLARVEAAIDFAEEDQVGAEGLAGVAEALDRLAAVADGCARGSGGGRELARGVPDGNGRRAKCRKVESSQSAGGERCSDRYDIPGTTRDLLEVHLNLAGIPVIVQDTAGLRTRSDDPIERREWPGPARLGRRGPNPLAVVAGRREPDRSAVRFGCDMDLE